MHHDRSTGSPRSRGRRRRRLRGVVPRAALGDRRGRALDLRRDGVVDPPARRGDRGARLRGRRRRGRGHAPRHALPRGNGNRGLGARDAHAARHRGRPQRSTLSRATWPRTRATSRRGSWRLRYCTRRERSASSRCSTARSRRSSACRRWSCSASSRTRPRSRSTCSSRRDGPSALLGDGGGDLDVVARLATAVDALEDERREAGLQAPERPRAHARRVAQEQKKARAAVHPARARELRVLLRLARLSPSTGPRLGDPSTATLRNPWASSVLGSSSASSSVSLRRRREPRRSSCAASVPDRVARGPRPRPRCGSRSTFAPPFRALTLRLPINKTRTARNLPSDRFIRKPE